MADESLPAVAGGSAAAGESVPAAAPKSSFLSFLKSGDVMRQVIIILTLAICLAVVVYLMVWAKGSDMRPLGQFTTPELIKTLNALDAHKFEYKVEQGTNTIYVKGDDYNNIVLSLKRDGIMGEEANSGDELILKDSGFGVSQRLESERMKLSREQQLAYAIRQYRNIADATVLLAIPRENVFARDQRKPSATVVVRLKNSGSMLKQEEVDAIVDTVASAVHNLEPSRVTVTDQNGRLLNSGSQDAKSVQARRAFEMEQRKESEYREKIDSILSPVLGYGNYTAEVDVVMDSSEQESTSKLYNPDESAVRSEAIKRESSSGAMAGGIPGALSNQPPAASHIPETVTGTNAGANAADGQGAGNGTTATERGNAKNPASGPQGAGAGTSAVLSSSSSGGRYSSNETRNYEIDTTISHTVRHPGGINRLTVSVGVDYARKAGADGKVEYVPRTPEELENIRRLLEGGLGFDVTRGDQLEVVSVKFNKAPVAETVAEKFYESDWFWRLVKIAASVLVILGIIMMIVKPMVMKLIYSKEESEKQHELDLDNTMVGQGDDDLRLLAQSADSPESLYNIKNGQLILPDLHRDEDLLKAVRALVSNEPDLAAEVVKKWVEEDMPKK
jgi:flagellar M-ring protein FliF